MVTNEKAKLAPQLRASVKTNSIGSYLTGTQPDKRAQSTKSKSVELKFKSKKQAMAHFALRRMTILVALMAKRRKSARTVFAPAARSNGSIFFSSDSSFYGFHNLQAAFNEEDDVPPAKALLLRNSVADRIEAKTRQVPGAIDSEARRLMRDKQSLAQVRASLEEVQGGIEYLSTMHDKIALGGSKQSDFSPALLNFGDDDQVNALNQP